MLLVDRAMPFIRLALLAPDIVEAILNGTQPATLQLSDLEQPFPID